MKKKACIHFYLLSIIFFSACNNQNTNEHITHTENAEINISGLFVNTSVLNSHPDSLLGTTANYCLEMEFLNKDSIYTNTGFDVGKVYYKKEKENLYNIKNATFKGDMLFEVINDSTILLIDSAWTNTKTPSVFTKSKTRLTFENNLNNKIITGAYKWLTIKDQTEETVEFTTDGKINGHKEFNNYDLCYAGDCMSEPSERINTMTLSGKTEDAYAFNINRDTKVISIYQLAPSIKDIKGDRKVEQKLYELIPNKK